MPKHTMTEVQAGEEALLLFLRKMRRMHNEAFNDVWAKLPDEARHHLLATEARADRLRLHNDVEWPDRSFQDDGDDTDA